jgi:ketosteroid isomerase-like protein
MRRLALLVFVTVAHAQTATEAVKALEEDWCKAWVAGDAATLNRIHADDYFSVNSLGAISSKAAVIADVRAGVFRYESMEHGDLSFRVYGDNGQQGEAR